MDILKNKVKFILKQKGMKSKELAQRIGKTEAALSNALASDNPYIFTVMQIAEALDVSVNDLIYESSPDVQRDIVPTTVTCPKCGATLELVVKDE